MREAWLCLYNGYPMKNIFKLLLIVTPLLSCGTNYMKVILAPAAPSDGWVKNRGSYHYKCEPMHSGAEAPSLSTTGAISYDYRQKTLFLNPVSDGYAKKQPTLQVISNGGALLEKSCPQDLVSIVSDKKTYKPIDAAVLVIYNQVNCNYFFKNDVIALKSAKLVFNPEYTACRIPALVLTNHVDKDSYRKTKNEKKKLFFEQ
jgi:hypothetical protein